MPYVLPLLLSLIAAGASDVYYGKKDGAKKPAEVVASDVFNEIPEYKKIKEKGLTKDDAEYWVLLNKANDKFNKAVKKVAEDAKYADLREGSRPMLYVPIAQHEQIPRELEVRTAGDPAALAATLRRELARVDERLTAAAIVELREQVTASLVVERLTATLSTVFGVLALALAAVGLYGVIAYLTIQRTAEIGLRIALGAAPSQVRRLVLGDIVRLVVLGVVIGLPVGLACARLLERQLYGVTPGDPLSLAAAIVTLVVAAFLAGALPARRATRVDPLIALRAE